MARAGERRGGSAGALLGPSRLAEIDSRMRGVDPNGGAGAVGPESPRLVLTDVIC